MSVKKFLVAVLTMLSLSACQTTDTNNVKNDDYIVIKDTKLFNYRALPKREEAPTVSIQSKLNITNAAECIQNQLKQKFKLPEGFYETKSYADRGTTVSLVNPFTKIEGLVFEIVPDGISGSKIHLYSNGTMISRAWQNLPNQCQ